MTFKLLCTAMILGIAVSIVWLIVELRADERDQERYDVAVPQKRVPPREGV